MRDLRGLFAAMRQHGLTVAIDWHPPIWTGRKRRPEQFWPANDLLRPRSRNGKRRRISA